MDVEPENEDEESDIGNMCTVRSFGLHLYTNCM